MPIGMSDGKAMKLTPSQHLSIDPITVTIIPDKPPSTVEYHRRSKLNPPRVTTSQFKGWQLQMLEQFMCPSQNLRVLYDPVGQSGKTRFLEALIHDDLKKYLIFEGTPSPLDFDNEIDMRENVCKWSGHCLIFNLYRGFKRDDMYRTLQLAADNEYCSNFWVFTTQMIDLTMFSKGRVQVYTLQKSSENEPIPDLLVLQDDDQA